MGRAIFKKIALPRNDLAHDVQNCLLTLMNRTDQEFPAPDFIADIVFDLACLSVAGGDDILVKIADPQVRNLLVV